MHPLLKELAVSQGNSKNKYLHIYSSRITTLITLQQPLKGEFQRLLQFNHASL